MDETLWKLENVGLSSPDSIGSRLEGINVEIRPGVTAVLGPSGAGKTSLLNLLVGFESADHGTITRTVEPGEHTLPVYWVPQSGGLWPHLRVAEHLRCVMPPGGSETDLLDTAEGQRSKVEGRRKRRSRPVGTAIFPRPSTFGLRPFCEKTVSDMLARFDLTARRDAWPDELSQGERSRLSVARALLSDAAVLVMDEPLAHVDTVQAGRYWQVVRTHLTERHTSLVFATHSPKTVLAEASRVICLGEGRLLFEGEVEELYRRPASRELAECLGEVNWLEPPDARLWFNVEREDALCLRPEQVAVVPAADGPDSIGIVALSRFKGDVAEVELEHTGTGKTRRIYHRPSGDHLKRGDKVLLKVILVLLIALFVGCEQSREPSLVMSEVHHWSMPPDGPKIPAPRSIATDPKGEVVVLDTSGRVLVFDRAGTFKRSWMMPEVQVGKPEGVCVLSDGRIAVSDTHYSRVILFDEEGKIVGRFGRQGTAPGEFIYPVGVAQDDAGNLYVSEYGSNDRVQKFTSDGKFLLAFGTFGTADDQFQRPSGMAWHDGKVYVADAVNNRIQVFSDDGKFLGRLGTAGKPVSLHMPYDIAMGRDGALYVIEYGAGRLTKLTLDGTVLGRFGTTGRGPEEFRTPWGLALDAAGTILVVDTGNRRIVELKP